MPPRDDERRSVAEALRRSLAIENQLSRPQARAYVRCLQASWDVPSITWSERDSERQFTDARRLLQAAHIFRTTEGAGSRAALDCFRRAGELLEWLARAGDRELFAVPIELLAAGAFQLGELPAMASGLLKQLEITHSGVALYAAFLQADFDSVIFLASRFWRSNQRLTRVGASARILSGQVAGQEGSDRLDWYFVVELVRAIGLTADSLRRGDQNRLQAALQKLHALDAMAVRTFSDDASLVVSLMCAVAENYKSASIYGPLDRLAPTDENGQRKLLRFAREQFSRGRGILWASQLQGLDRLVRDSSFALCTPTGSGKTLVANMALVKELLLRDTGAAPLAIYIVPSRALAGEVEAKLQAELGADLNITGLYGGSDWGITDYWINSQEPAVLIATVEKADAIMRYVGSFLIERLRLLIIDEAHQVVPESGEQTQVSFAEHSNRAIRLENLVSRITARRPDVVRIALTAVAGGASRPVARWVEGNLNAQAVGVRYRSTRQLIGVLETAPGSAGRILLDIMNGRPLYLRGEGEPVYIPLRTQAMPQLPAAMRNSLNRFNGLSVLWTALHLVEEGQRILISIAQEPERAMRWFVEALELESWESLPAFVVPEGDKLEKFNEARDGCIDYCGSESFELRLLDRGIATNHGQMPQRLRRLMTELIDRQICPITVATATLTEGVNLPFDVIFLTSLKRRSWDQVAERQIETPFSTEEFRNLAGRAGRPGTARGLEGMTIVALPVVASATAAGTVTTQNAQRRGLARDYERLRELLLIEESDYDDVPSPLALLLSAIRERAIRLLGVEPSRFLEWLGRTAPGQVSATAGEGAPDPLSRLADSLDELDGILLTALSELSELDDSGAGAPNLESRLIEIWRATFSSIAASREEWLRAAFIRRGEAVVQTLYPDQEDRQRLYHYGYSPVIGRRFEQIVPLITEIIAGAVAYGTENGRTRLRHFSAIGALLIGDRGFGFKVRATVTDQQLMENWTEVLAWWLNVAGATGPEADQLRSWQRFVSENLEFRLGVAIGAVVAQSWSAGARSGALPSLQEWRSTTGLPWFGFWARELLRWGTHDPFVAFTLSQGLAKTRGAAARRKPEFTRWLNDQYPNVSEDDHIDPQKFIAWEGSISESQEAVQASRRVSVELTGTRGERGKYSVVPVVSGDHVCWLDPAGYELARAPNIPERNYRNSFRNDYELRTQGRQPVIRRIYRGGR